MSLARVKETKAAKDYECEKCYEPILKGEQYLSYKVGFRSRYVHRRHTGKCAPRPSERESSMVADAYAAQESFEDQLSGIGSVEEVEAAVQEVADAFREVAGQYEEASTDDNGTVWNVDAEERQQIMESAADELENWSWGGNDPEDARCDEHAETDPRPEDCADCTQAYEDVLEEARDDAQGTVAEAELP